MVWFWLILTVSFFNQTLSQACTAFYWKDSQSSYFGKNYDWHHQNAYLITNKKFVWKKGFTIRPWEKGPKWVSKYGSITFNQYGREFPNGGMNEEGLAAEVLWLDSTQYEKADSRPVLNQLNWVQYQLDNFATVAEVIAALPKYRLSPIEGKIHYFICDRTSNCAVIEWLKGKSVVHSGNALSPKAITNHSYAESLAALPENQLTMKVNQPIEGLDSTSLPRFIKISSLLKTEMPSLLKSFELLNEVKMEKLTTWNIVYDQENFEIWYRTKANSELRKVNLKAFDYKCTSPVLMLDIHEGRGDTTHLFTLYDSNKNHELLKDSLGDIKFSTFLIPFLSGYPDKTQCDI